MAKLPNPSTFNRYVTIQQKNRVQNGLGGARAPWEDLSTMWCKISPLTASQSFFASHNEHRITHKIFTRYREDIDLKISQRIIFGGKVFQIHGVLDLDDKKRFLELTCEEGAGS